MNASIKARSSKLDKMMIAMLARKAQRGYTLVELLGTIFFLLLVGALGTGCVMVLRILYKLGS
jgi:hypothetical protein